MHLFYGGLVITYLLFSDLIKLTFRPWHLLIHESFTTREVSFENRTEELGDILTLLANLEECGTGICHEVGLAALGTAINDSAAPTYINLIFALSLMGDMPTNKARTSDNAQKQSASNVVPIFYSVFSIFQTSKRYDFYSVWACVSHAAACHDDHQVGFAQRHLLFCLIMHLNESFDFQKMFGSFFYLTAAKFALYQSIASIVKMKHQVGFQSVAVAIV